MTDESSHEVISWPDSKLLYKGTERECMEFLRNFQSNQDITVRPIRKKHRKI